jgi:hypothetical protein
LPVKTYSPGSRDRRRRRGRMFRESRKRFERWCVEKISRGFWNDQRWFGRGIWIEFTIGKCILYVFRDVVILICALMPSRDRLRARFRGSLSTWHLRERLSSPSNLSFEFVFFYTSSSILCFNVRNTDPPSLLNSPTRNPPRSKRKRLPSPP